MSAGAAHDCKVTSLTIQSPDCTSLQRQQQLVALTAATCVVTLSVCVTLPANAGHKLFLVLVEGLHVVRIAGSVGKQAMHFGFCLIAHELLNAATTVRVCRQA